MILDKMKLVKLLAISEAVKSAKEQKEGNEVRGLSNDITLPRLIITFTIFFFLLYLIIMR
jgi:hypothetical protein